MKRLVAGALVGIFTASALLVAAPALATGQGQVEGGDIYRIKNVTKNIDFKDPQTAGQCEIVQYKVRIHNPGPGVLGDVNVKAILPSAVATTNTSTVTVSGSNAFPQTTSDNAMLNLSSPLSVTYMNASTELLDHNGSLIKALPDGITGNGVNIGTVGVSINEKRFVQFQAKVNCPTPVQPTYSCDALSVTAVSRTKYTFTVKATAASGATITNYAFDFGDGTKVNSTTNTVSHEYVNEGKYVVTATLTVKVGDKTYAVNGKDCTNGVTITAAPVTPPTTPPTQPLPNTGPGNVVGLVAGSSAVATALHYGMAMRRSRRDEV